MAKCRITQTTIRNSPGTPVLAPKILIKFEWDRSEIWRQIQVQWIIESAVFDHISIYIGNGAKKGTELPQKANRNSLVFYLMTQFLLTTPNHLTTSKVSSLSVLYQRQIDLQKSPHTRSHRPLCGRCYWLTYIPIQVCVSSKFAELVFPVSFLLSFCDLELCDLDLQTWLR